MGSSSSRLRSGSPLPQVNRTKPRKFSSILCGCSSSREPDEMENYPAESLNSSVEISEPVFGKVQKQKDDLYLISGVDEGLIPSTSEAASSSEISAVESRENSEVGAGGCELSSLGICLQKGKELIPPLVNEPCTDGLNRDKSTTSSNASFVKQQSSAPLHISVNKVAANGISSAVSGEASEIYPENEIFGDDNIDIVENNNEEDTAVDTSTSSVSLDFDLPALFNSNSGDGDNSGEMVSSEFEFPVFDRELNLEAEDVVRVDVLRISSGVLSGMASDTSNWETRRNNRRSFWDVFADHNSTESTESQIVFSAGSSDYVGSRERWLFGYSDLFSNEGSRDGSGFLGSRIQRSNDGRHRRRFEIFDRLRTGLNENNIQTSSCPSGLHPDGECSCDRSLTAEISSAHESISRIVMLAEALFEVLDEIHHRPASFSLAIASDTAPESVVDSFPLKSYKKTETAEGVDSVEQCNICFAEYDEGDKIRVLPCHHEYHMTCVDKWLKEIHGVCPLCRGDVREGFTESPASPPLLLN